MNVFKRTVVEVVVIGLLASAVALAGNAFRSHSLEITKNHFPARIEVPQAPVEVKTDPVVSTTAEDQTATSANTQTLAQGETTEVENDPPAEEAQPGLEHEFQEVSFLEVVQVFQDPNTQVGVNVFIDARNDAHFVDGRIPGAIQCDPYRLADYVTTVLDAIQTADKAVVYCNGGECEDSILMCRHLLELGVPYYKLFLYAGGWEEWIANDMPVDKGGGE